MIISFKIISFNDSLFFIRYFMLHKIKCMFNNIQPFF